MMDSVRQYLLGITSAAAVCAVVLSLVGKKGSTSQLIRLLAGLFMAVTVLKPVLTLSLTDLKTFTLQVSLDAEDAVAYGEAMAQEKMEDVITNRTKQYIMEEAESLGATLQVDVELSKLVPVHVSLYGTMSPYARSTLSWWIEENLGIKKEAQEWNG